MLRPILILHRYLGVVLGVLMSLWCLSGFVMMYQSFPDLSQSERLGALEPLSLTGCCNVPGDRLTDDAEVSDFRIEMLGGAPVLRLRPAEGRPMILDLTSGEAKETITDQDAADAALRFGRSRGIEAPPTLMGVVPIDQWTIQPAKRNQPLRHYAFNDRAGTEVYVSGVSGEPVQDTNRKERVLSWLGAIPHWLYPTILRQNVPVWSQVVIWGSTIGVFLTVTGLYVGVMRFRRLPSGKWSPFKGWWYWHHMIGLVFGVLTLTWVTSGLLTMNPWGLLNGSDSTVRQDLSGKIQGRDIRRLIAALPRITDGRRVQLSSVVVGGQPYVIATDAKGKSERLDIEGAPAALQESEVRLTLAGYPIKSFDLMEKEDGYYYAHHSTVALPVYRAILADDQKSHVYVDATTGKLLRVVDGAGRQTRWLSSAFHDFDWPVIRARPVWDIVVILLLGGVTAGVITGTWLSFLRVGRDIGTFKVVLRRRKRKAQAAKTAQTT